MENKDESINVVEEGQKNAVSGKESNKTTLSNGKSIEKQIASVFGKTIGIVLVLLLAFVIYTSLFFPKTMSNITANLGCKNVSLYFAKVQYSRDKNINSLYTVVNKSIELNSYGNIEKYLEKLLNHEHYVNFIAFIENENLNSVSQNPPSFKTISLMISVSNEDMYLKNKYVESLIKNKKINKAESFSLIDFSSNNSSFEIGDRICWSFSHLFSTSTSFDFLTEQARTNIANFVNSLYEKYLENDSIFSQLNATQQFDFLVLENTLKRILGDLLLLEETQLTFPNLSFDEIKAKLTQLNS